MRNRNDFRCKDCRYYQTLFLYHENMEDYYETDYGLCADFDVPRPVRFDEDACGYFRRRDLTPREEYEEYLDELRRPELSDDFYFKSP